MKVLAVDDRQEDLYLLNKMLEGKGYEVVSAKNGKEAFEKIKSARPDIVISDILMPEVDGYQLLKNIKADENLSDIPFVFYTATYTSKKDEDFAYSIGASRFIVKPQEPETFMDILDKTIHDHEGGIITHSEAQINDEAVYLKEYNQRLVEKLEDKVGELETAREKIETHRDFLQGLIDAMEDGFIFVNVRDEVELANRKGKLLQEDVLKRMLPRLKQDGECLCDFDLEKNDLHYDVCCSPVMTPSGKFLGTTIVLRDITDRVHVKEELKSRVEELEKWQRLTVGREIKMIELKKRIKDLEKNLGKYQKLKEK